MRLHTFTQTDVTLASGAVLPEVRIAYTTRGTLAPDRRNVVLVAHGYTGGPDMILDGSQPVDGGWSALVGPGRAIDTDRWFVICPNVPGSPYGSTHAGSIDPRAGRPYGARFPRIGVADIVAGQRALLAHLGIDHLAAVAGASFGGAQVLQWGVDHPGFMDALVCVTAAPKFGGVDVAALRARLLAEPAFHGGDYYGLADLRPLLRARRLDGLRAFGAEAALAARFPDAGARNAELERLAAHWAEGFDANALLVIFQAMADFDVTGQLARIRAPLLYVLSRSDRVVPAAQAPQVLQRFADAGVRASYVEIDSDHGHCAPGTDAAKWAPQLRAFLEGSTALANGAALVDLSAGARP